MDQKGVTITNNFNEELGRYLTSSNYSKLAVLVDENTLEHCYPLLKLPEHLLIKIPSGEENKNLNTCSHIWNELTQHQFDRQGLFINLGGGVIGDMGGFCARTYKRGIPFLNIPTTLLSQVDASVGGKLGIDFNGFKNHIGLFYEPEIVIIDEIFLKTLPPDELRSGFAEVIKHHLIADSAGWENLKQKRLSTMNWQDVIAHSVEIKKRITKSDFKETGLRKTLNFGHTIGHAIETFYLNTPQKLLHGEAIALGMVCEAHISYQKERINKASYEEIKTTIFNHFESRVIHSNIVDELITLMGHDKKNSGGNIQCVLLEDIGHAVWDQTVSKEEINSAFKQLN